MDVLFVGDIVGSVGRHALRVYLERRAGDFDLVVANGENAAGGRGITRATAQEIFAAGVDVLTMGNHVWDKKDARTLLEEDRRILRPANYPEGVPGRGLEYFPSRGGTEVAVINLSGRAFLDRIDCPFRTGAELARRARQRTPLVILDFHAETTSEKIALRYHLDGRVSLLVGTHTHVQTNDDTVSGAGTGYITDVGMCGPEESVIGMKKEPCIERFLTGIPVPLETAQGRGLLCAVAARIEADGRCSRLEKIREPIF